MAPIRRSPHHGRWLGAALLGCYLALVPMAVPASAELSSVDAYGGQAQVLGKPIHHHHRTTGKSPGVQGAGRESGHSGGATGSQAGGGSSGPSGSSPGSVSHSTAGAGSGGPTTPSSANGAPKAGSGNTASGADAGSGGNHHGGAVAGAVGVAGASGVSAAGQSPPIAAANVADVSDGSLSLSALDVLLLVVVFAGLAGVGVLIRRWSRQVE
ncbi:MAG: hypothetical protein WB709_00305 [Solirubrobacteraceae bacterium]